VRERLSNRRGCETFNVVCHCLPYTVSVGRFPNGRLAEIFLQNCRSGSRADAAKDSAVVCSLALQGGVPVETIRKALLRDSRGNPSSPLGVALDIIDEEDAA